MLASIWSRGFWLEVCCSFISIDWFAITSHSKILVTNIWLHFSRTRWMTFFLQSYVNMWIAKWLKPNGSSHNAHSCIICGATTFEQSTESNECNYEKRTVTQNSEVYTKIIRTQTQKPSLKSNHSFVVAHSLQQQYALLDYLVGVH